MKPPTEPGYYADEPEWAELDSPNSVPPQLEEFAARDYKRINRWTDAFVAEGGEGMRHFRFHCERALEKASRLDRRLTPSWAQHGQEWKCTCGKVWIHVCDEAEGCEWIVGRKPKAAKLKAKP